MATRRSNSREPRDTKGRWTSTGGRALPKRPDQITNEDIARDRLRREKAKQAVKAADRQARRPLKPTGETITSTSRLHIVGSSSPVPAGTQLNVVRRLPSGAVVAQTKTGRYVTVAAGKFKKGK